MDGVELLEKNDTLVVAGETRKAIQDDPLTVLRIATAIAHHRGVHPTQAVFRACHEECELLQNQAPRAIREELERCLVGRDVDSALQWLQQVGVIASILPELEATKNLTQEGGRQHKDVWEHTILVVKQAVPRPSVRWAALFHDIGKVPTRTYTKHGVHFHGHAEVGARMFDKIARRLPFEGPDREKIRFLIKFHLRSNQYSTQWTDNAVRRFDREMGAHLVDLLDLSRADITSKRPGRRKALLHQISDLSQRIQALRDQDEKKPPLPTGLGNAIMEHFKLAPSRRIGDLRRTLEKAVEAGELEERRDADYYIAWLSEKGLVTD